MQSALLNKINEAQTWDILFTSFRALTTVGAFLLFELFRASICRGTNPPQADKGRTP